MSGKDRRRIIKYLAKLAVKHNLDGQAILSCLNEAWRKEKSKCNTLTISCRDKTEDSATFLFITGDDILAQFVIPIKVLKRYNISLIRYFISEEKK